MIKLDEAKVEQEKRELFHQMLAFISPENHDKAIEIWVKVTFDQYWLGWETGFDKGYSAR